MLAVLETLLYSTVCTTTDVTVKNVISVISVVSVVRGLLYYTIHIKKISLSLLVL